MLMTDKIKRKPPASMRKSQAKKEHTQNNTFPQNYHTLNEEEESCPEYKNFNDIHKNFQNNLYYDYDKNRRLTKMFHS
jgi:hypothetical protein